MRLQGASAYFGGRGGHFQAGQRHRSATDGAEEQQLRAEQAAIIGQPSVGADAAENHCEQTNTPVSVTNNNH